jgi:hypothetical protein
MTLDAQFDAANQAVLDALDELRRVLVDLGATPYVESVDYLKRVLGEDREAFFRSVNGGGVWRNMGSIADFGGREIYQALIRLADALDAAGLAENDPTIVDAQMFREWLAKPESPS